MARYWGFWTRGKLDLLRRYLDAFTTASSSLDERIYLDLFGGEAENRDRLTNELLEGSARIALSTSSPAFTRLRFFELEPQARKLDEALRPDFPSRDFEVVAGDCNETIGAVLAGLHQLNWAPTFAFIDPNGPHVEWQTLVSLSKFKKPTTKKAEIWLLFAAGLFSRNLRVDGSPVRAEDAERITRMFGTDQWRSIYEARLRGELEPGGARDEYVNLMRWRLEQELGYEWTHPLEIFNEQGSSIYHMIFATDHEAGDRIMSHLYNQAASEFPIMRQQARALRRRIELRDAGQDTLFADADLDFGTAPVRGDEKLYSYEPPTPPFGTPPGDGPG